MTRFPTLQHILLDGTQTSACAIHFINHDGGERRQPYREIAPQAQALLGLLQSRGAMPGDELIILTEHLEAFVETFWACVLGRIVAVPVAQGSAEEHRLKFFRIMEKLQRPFLVADGKSFDRLKAFAETNQLDGMLERLSDRVVFIEDIGTLTGKGVIHPAQPDDIAFIQFSSGSTSAPKGVMLTHRNLVTNIDAIIQAMGGLDGDSCLSWMPLTHDMGLIGFHLTPLAGGVDQWLMPTSLFVRRPMLWMMKANEHRVTVACSPNFGYKHFLKALTPDKVADLDLSRIRIIFNGAEPISATLCEDFLAALASAGLKPTSIFPVYGLAEASLAATFPPPGRALETVMLSRQKLGPGERAERLSAKAPHAARFVRLGNALANSELRIADDAGRTLPGDTVGRILIRGDNVTQGYYRDEARTAEVRDVDGWLDTGDLGAIVDGELVVTGRRKEIIFVAGQNYYPQDIEEVLVRHAGFELGKVAVAGARLADADADQVIAFLVFKGDDADFPAQARLLRRTVNERIGLVVDTVIPVRQLPKTTSGKIQRYLLARDFESGVYAETIARLAALEARAPSAANDLSEIETRLLAICCAHLPDKNLGADDNFFEAGVGSLTLAQIYEDIEAAYPDMLDVEALFENPSIRAITAAIHQKQAKAADA